MSPARVSTWAADNPEVIPQDDTFPAVLPPHKVIEADAVEPPPLLAVTFSATLAALILVSDTALLFLEPTNTPSCFSLVDLTFELYPYRTAVSPVSCLI